MLCFAICHLAHGGTSLTACGPASVEKILPIEWKIHSVTSQVVPKGHYWGQASEYAGPRGMAVVAIGPATVDFEFQGKSGAWSREALAKEALTLYFMPPAYFEDRAFSPKGPRSATLVFEGQGCKVYGFVSFQIIGRDRFDALLNVASATRWVGVPTSDEELSWPTWRVQLRRAMEGDLKLR